MATTKIWPIKGKLNDVIRYAGNEKKTRIPDLTTLNNGEGKDLEAVLEYAANGAKTSTERQLFVSGVNCVPAIACEQMEMTKQQFGKTGGTVAFHAYQSFPPSEVTPEQCHDLGVELARRVWGERFQVLVATHLNTDCCHNHFVINAVSFTDGKRYNDCKRTYHALQQASDALCREHGLSVIEQPIGRRTPRSIYMAEKRGEPTRYNVMRADIDRAVLRCTTPQELPALLQKMGYLVDFSPRHKYATLQLPCDAHPTRLKTLGAQYTEEALAQRIEENSQRPMWDKIATFNAQNPPVPRGYAKQQQDMMTVIMKATGLYKLYLHYAYLLGKLPKVPNYRPPHPALREDARRWNEIKRQLNLLREHPMLDMEEVAAFTEEAQQELTALIAQRTQCQNRLRRCKNTEDTAALHAQKDSLTQQITAKRKTLKTAEGIPARVGVMQQNLTLLQERKAQEQIRGR